VVSIIVNPDLSYPEAADAFSPDEAYPEYRHGLLSERPNRVYGAVRDMLAQAGLDAARFGTPAWNPLGGHIARGSRVFMLCNFVQHRRASESRERFLAKCVHASVLRALIDYVLIAVGPDGRVTFGNAPLQSTSWRGVLAETGAAEMLRFYESMGAPVGAADLRLLVAERGPVGNITHVERRDERLGVPIDLGPSSLFSALPGSAGRFRVPDYDPDRTSDFHAEGRHVYVVHREVLEADVVFSVPKLKTHQKVGITCALKGFVGAIAHKDCLPHYRSGPATDGGDEYPSDPLGVLQTVGRLHDYVQRQPPETAAGSLLRVVDTVTRRVTNRLIPEKDGSWHGNDTAWRMTLDIVRAAICGRLDGTIAPAPQRRHLVCVDGIVGGQGEGPLGPAPASSGALLFGDDLAIQDRACALLMGFDPDRIPLVREGSRLFGSPAGHRVIVNGAPSAMLVLPRHALLRFEPPGGWKGAVELA
jgi:uncharacterized protein (DUF362 family)